MSVSVYPLPTRPSVTLGKWLTSSNPTGLLRWGHVEICADAHVVDAHDRHRVVDVVQDHREGGGTPRGVIRQVDRVDPRREDLRVHGAVPVARQISVLDQRVAGRALRQIDPVHHDPLQSVCVGVENERGLVDLARAR